MPALYTGPRPSPARRWAPWVIATSVGLALCSAVLLVLNLVERDLLDQVASGESSPRSQMHSVLSVIGTTTTVLRVMIVPALIVSVGWAVSRRTRARVSRGGEPSVEPHLLRVWPLGYRVAVATTVLIVLGALRARAIRSSATSAADFVEYRTFLAVVYGLLIVSCVLQVLLVLRATSLQDQREADSRAADVEPQPVPDRSDPVAPDVGEMRLVQTFLMIVLFLFGAIFAWAGIVNTVTGDAGRGTAVIYLAVGVLLLAIAGRLFRVRRTRRRGLTRAR
jgi:hypothetical protein